MSGSQARARQISSLMQSFPCPDAPIRSTEESISSSDASIPLRMQSIASQARLGSHRRSNRSITSCNPSVTACNRSHRDCNPSHPDMQSHRSRHAIAPSRYAISPIRDAICPIGDAICPMRSLIRPIAVTHPCNGATNGCVDRLTRCLPPIRSIRPSP